MNDPPFDDPHVPFTALRLNVAPMLKAEFIVSVQLPVVGQPPPDQPAKVDPGGVVTISYTEAPLLNK